MNPSVTFKDTISPGLRAAAASIKNKKPILQAMGQVLVSITQGAFNMPNLRIAPWAPVKKTSGAPLKSRAPVLWRSIRVVELTNSQVTVGTDRPYAPYHQFGTKPYTIRPKSKKALAWPGGAHPVKRVDHPGLPARPFFPFSPSGHLAPFALRQIEAAAQAKIASLLSKDVTPGPGK
jgi:phage gpG-like protein